MSDIQVYLDEIRNALYGEEVRSSIVGAINQCYQDAADGVKPSIEFSEIQNGTRVTIRVGDEADSFNVINGARTQMITRRYTSESVTCAANSTGSIYIPIAFPEGYDFVTVVDVWSNGAVVPAYSTTYTLNDGGNVTVWWNNTADYSNTATFTVNLLFINHIEQAAGDDVIRNTMYPVGSVYISTNSANPSLLFGGTWRQIAQGRTLIGVGSIAENTTTDYGTVTADSFSPAVNDRGGEVKHTLSVAELPTHRHTLGYGGNVFGSEYAVASSNPGYQSAQSANITGVTGSNTPHNNMMPYLAVYIWERTA